jgi:hypothetical protein
MNHIDHIKTERNEITGIRLGDFVLVAGVLERVCVLRHDSPHLQTTNVGSWFLGRDGYTEFSGTCINLHRPAKYDLIDKSTLRQTGTAQGDFWTFKDGQAFPFSRENFATECKIFEMI